MGYLFSTTLGKLAFTIGLLLAAGCNGDIASTILAAGAVYLVVK